jgi:hypothetical protein
LTILAGASELAAILHAKTRKMSKKERKDRQAKVEELEKDLEKEKENLGIEESPLMRKESKVAVSSAAARRARALLWAHLLRFEVDAEAKKGECPGATFGRFGQWPAGEALLTSLRDRRAATRSPAHPHCPAQHLPRTQLARHLTPLHLAPARSRPGATALGFPARAASRNLPRAGFRAAGDQLCGREAVAREVGQGGCGGLRGGEARGEIVAEVGDCFGGVQG